MKKSSVNHHELIDKYVIYSATDLDGIITEASQAFSDISEYSKEELIGKPHSIVKHPDMKDQTFKQMWDTISKGGIWEGDILNLSKSGNDYWVHARVEPLYDKKGDKEGYFAVREAISDKVLLNKSNKELFEQVNVTKAILNNSKTAIATINKDGFFVEANAFFKKKFKPLNQKQINHICLGELIDEKERKKIKEEVTYALKKRGKCHFKRLDLQKNFTVANSKKIPCEVYMNLLPDRQNVVVVINFIGDKLKLKNSLKKSKIYFKKASLGYLITNKKNTIIKVNPRLRDILNYEKGQVKNRSLGILFETQQMYNTFINNVEKTLEKSKQFQAVYLLQKNNQEDFWAEIYATKFSDDEVIKDESIFYTIRDITSTIKAKQIIEKQNKELIYLNENLKNEVEKQVKESIRKDKIHQEEQVKNAKFSAIGQLAAGITHEINTPLTYIRGNFEMMELDVDMIEDLNLKNEILEQLKPIKEGLGRIGNIVENMREISQKTKEEKVVTNIYATMVTALTVMQNRIKHISKVTLNDKAFFAGCDKDELEFFSYAQPQRLEHVWMILINNALDELQKIQSYEKRKFAITMTQDQYNVYITFKDNAGGVDENILEKVFDPFEGDKTSNGVGIGLNVAKQIITQQNGDIEARNENGCGIFEVKLKRYKA